MPFDWRDYIEIEKDRLLLDDKGNPTPRLLKEEADTQKSMMSDAKNRRANEDITERTMDQISLIPEVQKLIIDGHRNFQDKLKKNPDLAKESGGKIHITFEDTKTDYTYNYGIVNIHSDEFGESKFQSPHGPQTFSLQQVLIHELGHAADPTLGDAKDLKQKLAAVQEGVKKTLQFYPELKEEYAKHQTMMGRSVGNLLQAKNPKEFRDIFRDQVLKGNDGLVPIAEIRTYVDLRNTPAYKEIKDDSVITVFNTFYKHKLEQLSDAQDEMPVVRRTNEIMKGHYEESPRTAYITLKNPRLSHKDLFDSAPDLLAPYVHPNIEFGKGLASTTRCDRGALRMHTCAAAHIDGASYPAETKPSAASPTTLPTAAPVSKPTLPRL